jgi:hypothetical protein
MWNLLFEVETFLAMLSHDRNAVLDTPTSLDNVVIGMDSGGSIRLTMDCLYFSEYVIANRRK